MLAVTGAAGLDGTLDVTLLNGFNPMAGEMFTILTALGGVNGTFASSVLPAGFTVTYLSNSVVLTAPVPEPASAAVFALFGVGLLARRRRR